MESRDEDKECGLARDFNRKVMMDNIRQNVPWETDIERGVTTTR